MGKNCIGEKSANYSLIVLGFQTHFKTYEENQQFDNVLRLLANYLYNIGVL